MSMTTDIADRVTTDMLRELGCEEYGPATINSGLCAEWAERVVEAAGGAVIWIGRDGHMDGDAHAVVELGGLYYDAETTDGTDDPTDLEWVSRGGVGLEYVDDEGTTWCPWDDDYQTQE